MNLGMEDEHTEHKRSTSELREGMESVASILNKHDVSRRSTGTF